MAKTYDNLLVPEAYTALRPYDFVIGVLKCIRTTTNHLAKVLGLSLRTVPTRPYYKHVNVHIEDITTSIVGGVVTYQITLPVEGVDVIGCLLSEPALRGRDFTCTGAAYTFINKHPSAYGTVSSDNVLSLVCAGGSFNDYLNPISVPYRGCTDITTTTAIDESIHDNAPMGVTARLLEAIGSAHLSTTELTTVWVEGDYTLGITAEGELVYAPTDSGIVFQAGAQINTSAVTAPLTDVFYAKLPSGHTILTKGINHVADHPQITQDIPGLVINNGTFNGVDVLAQLVADGYIFYHWNSLSNTAGYAVLPRYQVNPGKAAISINAQVENPTNIAYTTTSDKFTPIAWTITSQARAYNYI